MPPVAQIVIPPPGRGATRTVSAPAPSHPRGVEPREPGVGTVEQGPFALVSNGLGTVQAYNTVQVRTRVDGEIQQVVDGGSGDDTIYGNRGDDVLYGDGTFARFAASKALT